MPNIQHPIVKKSTFDISADLHTQWSLRCVYHAVISVVTKIRHECRIFYSFTISFVTILIIINDSNHLFGIFSSQNYFFFFYISAQSENIHTKILYTYVANINQRNQFTDVLIGFWTVSVCVRVSSQCQTFKTQMRFKKNKYVCTVFMYLCLFNKNELSCSYDKTVQRFTFAAQNNKVIPNNVCLFPQNSFWYLTLPCQTFTSSPRCRSCGRWRPSRWWAVCHFTSSSTCEDASARPTTPSWPLKDWDEPVASFKTEGCPCLHPADPALRPENQTPDSSPLICFWKVLLGNVKRRTVMSGTECLLRGRAGVMKQRHLLHVFDAKTIWWFLSAEAELV